MKNLIKPTRTFLGIFFVIFGLNGLALIFAGGGFLPMPAPAESFAPIMGGLFAAKFVMPTAKLIQLGAGLLLISNRYTSLALALLAPVIFSILAAHLVVGDFAGAPLGIIATVCWVILILNKKESYRPLFAK